MSGSFVHRVELADPVSLRSGDSMKMEVELHCMKEELIITKINAFFQPIEGGVRMEVLTIAGEHGTLDHTGLSGPDKDLMAKMSRGMAENIDRQFRQAAHVGRSQASKFGDVAIIHPSTHEDLMRDPKFRDTDPLNLRKFGDVKTFDAALTEEEVTEVYHQSRGMPGEGWDEL